MFLRKAFSLMEILIALVLTGMIILAVTSADIASRRFFGGSLEKSRIQDEAKIAMEHIVRHIQQGIGDMTFAGTTGDDPYTVGSTRGFYILDNVVNGLLTTSGNVIHVKLDRDRNGRFDGVPPDEIVEYIYNPSPIYTVVYQEQGSGLQENLADGMVSDAIFSFDSATPNQIDVSITVRQHPESTHPASLDNPETTLTSSIILRAMSTD